MKYRTGWIVLAVLAILSPLGLLAIGGAWGEWGVEEIDEMVGFVPEGMQTSSERQPDTPFPDYEMPGLGGSGWEGGFSTVLSALIGAGLTAGVTIAVLKLLRYGRIS